MLTTEQIQLDGGKYAIHYDRETGQQWATRRGEYWRDLTGDKLILALVERGNKAYAAGAKDMQERCAKVVDSVNNYDNPMTATDCTEAIRALETT